MIWLMALACGDKDDPKDSSTSDSPSADSADTGDSDPVDPHCELGPMSPATLPLAGAEVVFHYACTGTSMASVGTEEGDWACEQEGATLVCQSSSFASPGQKEVALTDVDGQVWLGSVRVHSEPVLEAPEGLVEVQAKGTLVHLGEEELLVLGESSLQRVLLDGSVDKEFALSSDELCEDCWTQGSPEGVIGVEKGTVHVLTLESQASYASPFDSTLDASLHSDGVRAVGSMSSSDRGESVYASELGSGKIWSLGALDGELRILDLGVVEASCEKEQLVFTDIMWSNGKQVSSAGGPFECFPTTWKVSLMDVDGDGHEDQVHALDYESGQSLGVRFGDGSGAFGETKAVQTASRFQSFRFDEGSGRVLYDDHGRRWAGLIEEGETSTLAADNPVFVGQAGPSTNVLGQLRPNPSGPGVAQVGEQLYLLTGEEWVLANGSSGESLVRVKKPGSFYLSFQVAGKEVQGLGDAHAAALYGEHSLFFSEGEALFDDTELSSGDFTVTPLGQDFGGHVALAWRGEAGVGLSLMNLDDPGDEQGRIRKQPDMLTGEWDTPIDDEVEILVENPLASMTPPSGTAGETPYPSVLATLEWETGTDCPYATVLVPGISEDMDSNWEVVQVLATSESADCADLAFPIGSADLYGDGGSVGVLSDGTLYRLLEFQIPEKVVMEKEDDFYGLQSGDFNGDGLGDMVLVQADGERLLWLSDGEGGSLGHEGELPTWIWMSRMAGPGPGAGAPPVTLFSWGLVLD